MADLGGAHAAGAPPYICRIPFFCLLTDSRLCAFGAHMGSRAPPFKNSWMRPPLSKIPGSAPVKAPVTKAVRGGGVKTSITHDNVLPVGISVHLCTKAFCYPFCILFMCSERCSICLVIYRLGCWRIISTWRRWVGLAYKSSTGDPPFLLQYECDSSPFDHQSILMKCRKDHFMGTAKIM